MTGGNIKQSFENDERYFLERKNLSDFYRTKFTTKQMINNYTSEWDKLLCI